jgi:5-methylcytosine-specific restriction endonuclease McrA
VAVQRGGGRQRKQFNARILMRDPFCTEPGCRRRSEEVHHIVPVVDLPPGANVFDPSNVRGLCKEHHLQSSRRRTT